MMLACKQNSNGILPGDSNAFDKASRAQKGQSVGDLPAGELMTSIKKSGVYFFFGRWTLPRANHTFKDLARCKHQDAVNFDIGALSGCIRNAVPWARVRRHIF